VGATRTAMDPDLAAWLQEIADGPHAVTSASWPNRTPTIWRVRTREGFVYLKRARTAADYAAETKAYDHAATLDLPGRVPVVLHRNPVLSAFVMDAVPGETLLGPTVVKRIGKVPARAAAMVRAWHDGSPTASEQDRLVSLSAMYAYQQEAGECLQSTGHMLTGWQRRLIGRAATELRDVSLDVPHAYLHGDFSPRNWLWDHPSQTYGLIDFEKAHHGPVPEEFVWLYGAVWVTEPEAMRHFFKNYGRDLTAVEKELAVLLVGRLAVSYLSTGLAGGSEILVDRGLTVLAHLEEHAIHH
jgi:Ser/Thr protein kinase RdoA (MazF antagonist)